MDRRLILVLGGVRSGKSAFAEDLAKQIGENVLYVATADVGDDEMRHRVEEHRRRRPESWRTVEIPLKVGMNLQASMEGADVVLIDCLSVLVANVLQQYGTDAGDDVVDAAANIEEFLREEMSDLLACYRGSSASFVIVSNEVGHGVVPPYPLGRIYRDVLGLANQYIAREADEVYMLVAGVPIELKALSRITGQAQIGRLIDSF